MSHFLTDAQEDVGTQKRLGTTDLNSQHLACEVRTRMYEVLTKSGLSFVYKMIREIISVPRVDSGYSHNFWVNS